LSAPRPAGIAAVDALGRGIANVRANAELLIVQFFSSLLIAVSILTPLLLLLRDLGIPPSILIADDPAQLQAAIAGIELDLTAILPAIGKSILVVLVGGTILFLFYCWAQAGTLAVLAAGEAQAPPARRPPVDVFRTFSWRGFFSWSFRYGGRLFWLMNLYIVLMSLPVLLLSIAVAFLGRSFDETRAVASCLLGCGLALPVLFVMFVLGLALNMSSAVLVVEDAAIGRSTRRGLSLTGRRFGGLLLLVLLLVAASMAVAVATLLVELGARLAFPQESAVGFAVNVGLEILRFLLTTILGLIFSSALISLVRSERQADAAPGPAAA
jgi:hypothetical protein